jgi:magnesium transporter
LLSALLKSGQTDLGRHAMAEPAETATQQLLDAWSELSARQRLQAFQALPRDQADAFFLELTSRDQRELLHELPRGERRIWLRLLPPDDAADVIQPAREPARSELLAQLDDVTRREVAALLAYKEDEAGGVMNPRFARLRPDVTIDQAISYLRRQAGQVETIYDAYALDDTQHLLGVVSIRDLFSADRNKLVRDVMRTRGSEALDAPYLEIGFWRMVKKRAGWLAVLFVGEMFTASAMGYFEHEIARAVVLALFVPLVISSGGNSGSRAATLVIRAMAVGEVHLRDGWRVILRELSTGFVLGAVLAAIGLARILARQAIWAPYGEHFVVVALTVAASLAGVVLFGTIAGSMLPFILRGLGQDPASASAPFAATMVDVTGLVICFSLASVIMRVTLL